MPDPNTLELVKQLFTLVVAAVAAIAAISILRSEDSPEKSWTPVDPS